MPTMTSALESAFDTDFFMKLLITELQNQDPEAPMSNAELTGQLSALAQVEGMNALNMSFKDMLQLQRLVSGAELVGREVEYDNDGVTLSGLVQEIRTRTDGITLLVDGDDVSLSQLTKIL